MNSGLALPVDDVAAGAVDSIGEQVDRKLYGSFWGLQNVFQVRAGGQGGRQATGQQRRQAGIRGGQAALAAVDSSPHAANPCMWGKWSVGGAARLWAGRPHGADTATLCGGAPRHTTRTHERNAITYSPTPTPLFPPAQNPSQVLQPAVYGKVLSDMGAVLDEFAAIKTAVAATGPWVAARGGGGPTANGQQAGDGMEVDGGAAGEGRGEGDVQGEGGGGGVGVRYLTSSKLFGLQLRDCTFRWVG